jgi:hypothetical protein
MKRSFPATSRLVGRAMTASGQELFIGIENMA